MTSTRDFLTKLGGELHNAGASADALEDALASVARRLEVDAEIMSTPTALTIAFAEDDVRLLRREPAEVNLARLQHLYQLIYEVERGDLDVERAAFDVPQPWTTSLTGVAFFVVSCAVGVLNGCDLLSAAIAGLAGASVFALVELLKSSRERMRAVFLLAAVVVNLAAAGVHALSDETASASVVIAGLIVLFPGYSLTVAVSELAGGHLVAGTSRMMGSVLVLLMLAVGTALCHAGLGAVNVEVPARATTAAGLLVGLPSVLFATLGLTVILQGELKSMPSAVVVSLVAFTTQLTFSALVGPWLSVGVAAFFVTFFGKWLARRQGAPSATMIVPAIILLVPGAAGYRSVMELASGDTVQGVRALVITIFVAVAIVAGMIIANAVAPRRMSHAV